MTDLFGVPVSVGDKVAYTLGGQGAEYMEIGTILSIDNNFKNWSGIHTVAYLKSASGRKMTNPRWPSGIISLTPVKTLHPELFI